MKAFSYLRVSGRAQIPGDGFPRQREAINAWAVLNGVEIVQEFAEEGISGETDWDQRPAFQDLVGALLENGTRVVAVENLTRLARSFVVQDAIVTYLASRGISLISADTGEDITKAVSEDPMKKAIIQMQAVFAELEKNSLVRKLRAARKRKRAAGHRVEGRKPFGARKGEPETIRRMVELRAEGMSYRQIAFTLDQEGHPTRDGRRKKGKTWSSQSIWRILEREKGKGKVAQ